MVKLTQEEYRQLEAIRDNLWIARDKDNSLYIYLEKPLKEETHGMWYAGTGECVLLDKNLLPSLTWEDGPLNIDKALEGRGCDKWIKLHKTVSWLGELYKCPTCKETNIGLRNYCPNCGRRLEESE